jgi:hypothetical protein
MIKILLSGARKGTLLNKQWIHKHFAQWVDDVFTRNHNLFGSAITWIGDGIVAPVLFLFCVLIDRRSDATTFESDMDHRTLQFWTYVYSGRTMELCALRAAEGVDYKDKVKSNLLKSENKRTYVEA